MYNNQTLIQNTAPKESEVHLTALAHVALNDFTTTLVLNTHHTYFPVYMPHTT